MVHKSICLPADQLTFFLTTWVESSYTIYKSLHFNLLIPLYLSPVIKQFALNKNRSGACVICFLVSTFSVCLFDYECCLSPTKNCAVVLVWFVCLISIFSVCLFDYECCLILTQSWKENDKQFNIETLNSSNLLPSCPIAHCI